MKTYLFYDIETSGLNPVFDQILTFACIRTDPGLNELERHAITICLRKDIVPSANAFLTHGLTPDELALGISEYKAAVAIHKIFNTPDTISLGYNSLGFDDDFLRFMFYRNLLDPYLHQYGNGCARMDVLPIAVVFRVFSPACIKWPCMDGKTSLKLDRISRENDLVTSGRAHEAMNDVEALIGLSRKLSVHTDIWKYCLDFFNKTLDEVRINSIQKEFCVQDKHFRLCIMVSVSFGSDMNFMAPVIQIGQSRPYKNQSLWLRLDSDDILGIDAQADLKDTFVIRKRPGDQWIVLPAFERFWNRMTDTSQQTAKENMEKIRTHEKLFFEFIEYHVDYHYPMIPDIDPDAALYQDGFFSSQEKKQCELFHRTPDHQKQTVLNQIQSPRIKTLASRILFRNFGDFPDQVNGTAGHRYLDRLRSPLEKDQIKGYRNDMKFNRNQGLKELQEIDVLALTPDQQNILAWLKAYIRNL